MSERRDEELIERIAAKRMANNVNWMMILEIALTYAPDKTRKVLRLINDTDRDIGDLLKDLAQ